MTDSKPDPLDAFLERGKREMAPKLSSSAFVMALDPGDEIDPKIALEIGYAVLLNKPIMVVAKPGRSNDGLRRIATRVLEGDPADPMFQLQLNAAIQDMSGK